MKHTKKATFMRKDDELPEYMLEAVKKVSDHFKIKRDKNYLYAFCGMFKKSKHWNPERIREDVEAWKASFTKSFPQRNNIAEIIKEAFSNCSSKDDINDLRGYLLEALLIGLKGGFNGIDKPGRNSRGWGAKVYLEYDGKSKGVYYECSEHKFVGCSNRSTVDYGEWVGRHGQFYECKVSPKRITCKEIQYMKHLKSELEDKEFSHELSFYVLNLILM